MWYWCLPYIPVCMIYGYICVYTCPLPSGPPSHPLGCHRAPGWAPSISQESTASTPADEKWAERKPCTLPTAGRPRLCSAENFPKNLPYKRKRKCWRGTVVAWDCGSILKGPEIKFSKISKQRLVGSWLRFHVSNAGGTGLIPGRGTKISHAMQWGQTNFLNYKILKKKNKQSLRE